MPLYRYQAEGALFAVQAGRSLIGDDMGLGKTIQAIAAAEILARHFGVTRVLVICPTSLKYQWQSEIARFAGHQGKKAPRVIGGGRAQRRVDYAAERFLQDHQLRHAPAGPRSDRSLGAGAGHRRRGPAHQELEHHRRARLETHRQHLCDRADRNAAGEQAGRADLDRPVRRPASAWARPGNCCTSTRSRTTPAA